MSRMSTETGFKPEDIFGMTERQEGGKTIVSLAGELDLGNVGIVERRLSELRELRRSVVLDLDRLTFMDSTGIRLLLTACEHAERDSWPFAVTRGSERVQRVLTAARVADRLPYADAP
jgi:anti-sigma B factor antagonist